MFCLLFGNGVVRVGLVISSVFGKCCLRLLIARVRGGCITLLCPQDLSGYLGSCVLFGSGPNSCDCVSFDA